MGSKEAWLDGGQLLLVAAVLLHSGRDQNDLMTERAQTQSDDSKQSSSTAQRLLTDDVTASGPQLLACSI
jgi:hypothetical protein